MAKKKEHTFHDDPEAYKLATENSKESDGCRFHSSPEAQDLPNDAKAAEWFVKSGYPEVKDFAPTSYAAASCQNARTESTSTPGISYSEADPGDQTHTRWYYGFRTARALIISGTIIYTIHRGLFEFLGWVFARR